MGLYEENCIRLYLKMYPQICPSNELVSGIKPEPAMMIDQWDNTRSCRGWRDETRSQFDKKRSAGLYPVLPRLAG